MKTLSILILTMAIAIGCQSNRAEKYQLLSKMDFDSIVNGKPISLYTLQNDSMAVQLTNYGARLVAVWVPSNDGSYKDVVWGYKSLADYMAPKADLFAGPIVGRYGNRIKGGNFSIDGEKYTLTINNNKQNHLHGGPTGWSTKVWTVLEYTDKYVAMQLISPDGDNGYPGEVNIIVRYELSDDNALRITYKATTDSPTILNPTSHAYFNLHGTTSKDVLSHQLKIYADSYTPTDSLLIPTGKIANLETCSPLDFRETKQIGKDINAKSESLYYGKGYDHNWVLNKSNGSLAAEVYEPATGICMQVYTDQPGIQFYSGNFMKGQSVGKRGDKFDYRTGFALETQNYPDAPNHDNFPSSRLNPGEIYTHECIYKFGIM